MIKITIINKDWEVYFNYFFIKVRDYDLNRFYVKNCKIWQKNPNKNIIFLLETIKSFI